VRQAGRRGAEEVLRAFPALADEVRAAEHREVLRDRWLRDPERPRQVSDGALPKPDALQQLAPRRVDQRTEDDSISHYEYKYTTI
jgi:hypothetical protein